MGNGSEMPAVAMGSCEPQALLVTVPVAKVRAPAEPLTSTRAIQVSLGASVVKEGFCTVVALNFAPLPAGALANDHAYESAPAQPTGLSDAFAKIWTGWKVSCGVPGAVTVAAIVQP